jgi:hypothetical protein
MRYPEHVKPVNDAIAKVDVHFERILSAMFASITETHQRFHREKSEDQSLPYKRRKHNDELLKWPCGLHMYTSEIGSIAKQLVETVD